MGKSPDDLSLTDDKEKLKTVPEDAGNKVDRKSERDEISRREQLKTRDYLGEDGPPAGGGSRSGGQLARDIGTKDEMKRSKERPAGKTRVHKSEERGRD